MRCSNRVQILKFPLGMNTLAYAFACTFSISTGKTVGGGEGDEYILGTFPSLHFPHEARNFTFVFFPLFLPTAKSALYKGPNTYIPLKELRKIQDQKALCPWKGMEKWLPTCVEGRYHGAVEGTWALLTCHAQGSKPRSALTSCGLWERHQLCGTQCPHQQTEDMKS